MYAATVYRVDPATAQSKLVCSLQADSLHILADMIAAVDGRRLATPPRRVTPPANNKRWRRHVQSGVKGYWARMTKAERKAEANRRLRKGR